MIKNKTYLVEKLVEEYIHARRMEREPRTYRWLVDKNDYNRVYNQVTPVARIENGSGVSFMGDDAILLHTDSGTVPVINAKEENSRPENHGEVVSVLGMGPALVANEVDYTIEEME